MARDPPWRDGMRGVHRRKGTGRDCPVSRKAGIFAGGHRALDDGPLFVPSSSPSRNARNEPTTMTIGPIVRSGIPPGIEIDGTKPASKWPSQDRLDRHLKSKRSERSHDHDDWADCTDYPRVTSCGDRRPIEQTNCHAALAAPNPMKMAARACMIALVGPYFQRNPQFCRMYRLYGSSGVWSSAQGVEIARTKPEFRTIAWLDGVSSARSRNRVKRTHLGNLYRSYCKSTGALAKLASR
jgi:hypothetical protein